ncbi:MAG: hypothetical protein JXR68_10050 [Bacteroidales bacterium]|nr:hypothetical protein [Bacteroidales bacterium]
MKINLKIIMFGIITIISSNVFGQVKENWNHNIGINLLQIPATTIDLTYELNNKPRYMLIINPGYTFNYTNSYDYIGFFLSPHYKCGNNGYYMKKQSGGYIKIGLKYIFRNSTEKNNFFYLGAFITNSMVYEKAEYENMDISNSQIENLSHNIFILGFSSAVGYNFGISNRLTSDFGVHISLPSKKYDELYGYSNYIPGMGYMETCGNQVIFPMLILNLKYKIKR